MRVDIGDVPIGDLILIGAAVLSLLWLGWWWVRHGSKG